MQGIQTLSKSLAADPDVLRRCRAAISAVMPEAEIILYGSRARGTASEDSDYDLIVLVDTPDSADMTDRIRSSVYPIELDTGAMLTVLVYSKAEWKSPVFEAMPFHKNVERDGVLL